MRCGFSFSVLFSGKSTGEIRPNATTEDVKLQLELLPKVGEVKVQQTGTCINPTFAVEWTNVGGDLPTLGLNAKGVKGLGVQATVVTVQDGGLSLRPIPGDMLRTIENSPTVGVLER